MVLASVATAGWFHGAPHACSQEWMTGIDQHFSPVLRHNACRTTDPLLGGTRWACDGVCGVRSENNSTRKETRLTPETETASIPKGIMDMGRGVCVVLEPCIGIASTAFDLRVFAQGCHAPSQPGEVDKRPPSPPPSVRRFQLTACVCGMSSAQAARASQRKPTLKRSRHHTGFEDIGAGHAGSRTNPPGAARPARPSLALSGRISSLSRVRT